MKKHCVVDLETLSTNCNSAILSIGAVIFDSETYELGETFYTNVDVQSCLDVGATVSGSTLMWWINQTIEAKQGLMDGKQHINDALSDFSRWLSRTKPETIWSNGADFDLPILKSLYSMCKMTYPLSYKQSRCYRTLTSLYPIEVARQGVYHNALDDSIHQAKVLIEIVKTHNLSI